VETEPQEITAEIGETEVLGEEVPPVEEAAAEPATPDDVPPIRDGVLSDALLAKVEDLADQVRDALESVEVGNDRTQDYLYVQSVIISNKGQAIFRLRWNGDTYRYEPSLLIDTDGRY